MKTCYGYVRVSTVKQGEGVSLDAQKEAISQFADRNDFTVVEWFTETVTAAKRGRPQFNKMVSALRKRKADGVIFHKIDRSARNFADWAKVGDLIDAGVDVRFAHEDMDLQSRGGRLTADIQAVIAADYVRNLKEEIHKGIKGRLKQGLYLWPAPIGYCNNGRGKPKTPHPKTAPLIRQMFELYASGEFSYNTLLLEMQRRGLRGRKGVKLTMRGLETILKNPFYCGIIHIKRTGSTYNGIHEPLVSVALYQKAQAMKDGKCGKKITKHNHLLRGLFRCGLCQKAMIPERQKGNVYYRCQRPQCDTKTVREEIIEKSIIRMLRLVQLRPEDIDRAMLAIDKWVSEREHIVVTNKNPFELNECEAKLERLTDALISRLIDEDTFKQRKAVLQLEIAQHKQAQREQVDLRGKAAQINSALELVKNLGNAYVCGTPSQKRQIARFALSNRNVIRKSPCVSRADWVCAIEKLAILLGG